MDEHFDVGVSLTLDEAVVEELQRAQDRIKIFEKAAQVSGLSPATLSAIARPIILERAPVKPHEQKSDSTVTPDSLATAPLETYPGVQEVSADPPKKGLSQTVARKVSGTTAEKSSSVVHASEGRAPGHKQFSSPQSTSPGPKSEHTQPAVRPLVAVAPAKSTNNALGSGLNAAPTVLAETDSSAPTTSLPGHPSVSNPQRSIGNGAQAGTNAVLAVNSSSSATASGAPIPTVAPSDASAKSVAFRVTNSPAAPKVFRHATDSSKTSPTDKTTFDRTESSKAQSEDADRNDDGKSASRSAASISDHLSITGDVYLDGAVVGKWMSRLLGRDAERATAGPTGFDGRRGRLLPGPTVA